MQSFMILFILFQISTCFIRFIHKNKMNNCLKSRNVCFPDDDERPYRKVNNNEIESPLYTLIWYDCESCKKLLQDMEKLYIKHIYINGGEYFYENHEIDTFFNTPLLYKDEIFIGDNLFDIYSEIYREEK